MFRRKKIPENKIVQQESSDLKTPENESWISFLKKKISKEESPPVECCQVHQAKLRKVEEEKALQEGREPEKCTANVTIVTEESGNPFACKTPVEPQPQPPPQPPLPRAVKVMKEDVAKTESKPEEKCDLALPKKSFNMQLPYEEFKIPIVSKPPPPVSSESLQPRKLPSFKSSEKVTDSSTFQPCKKFHQQSNLEFPSKSVVHSKDLQRSNVILNVNKANETVESQTLAKNNMERMCKKSASNISKTPVVSRANSKLPDNLTFTPQSEPKKVPIQYVYHPIYNQLLPKPIIKKDDAQEKIQAGKKNVANTVINQNEHTNSSAKLVKTSIGNNDIQPVMKACSVGPQTIRNLQKLSEGISTAEKTTHTRENNGNKEKSAVDATKKIVNLSQIPEISSNKQPKTAATTFLNLNVSKVKEVQRNPETRKQPSFALLLNVNKPKQSEKIIVATKESKSVKLSTRVSPIKNHNTLTSNIGRVSQCTRNADEIKFKGTLQKRRMENKKSTRHDKECSLSSLKKNCSPVGLLRKSQKSHLGNSKLSSKERKQSLLPSDIPPFFRPDENMPSWCSALPDNLVSVKKLVNQCHKKPAKSAINNNIEYCKEPWFTKYQKNYVDTVRKNAQFTQDSPSFRQNSIIHGKTKRIHNNLNADQVMDSIISPSSYANSLQYRNINILESRLRNSPEGKEQFSASSITRKSKYNNLFPKNNKMNTFSANTGDDSQSYGIQRELTRNFQDKPYKFKNSINRNRDKFSGRIKRRRQKIYAKESSLYPSELFKMDQPLYNKKIKEYAFSEDTVNHKYPLDSGIQSKYLDSISKLTCDNSSVNTMQQPQYSNSINSPVSISARKHIPIFYEKSCGQCNTTEPGIERETAEESTNNVWNELITICPEKPAEKKHKQLAKSKKGKADDCEGEDEEWADKHKFALLSASSKPEMKCAAWEFVSQQRSYSVSNFNSHCANNKKPSIVSDASQSLKRTYSYKMGSHPSRGSIQCKKDDNISSPPSTDPLCRKIGEQEQENNKSGKTCAKVKSEGCKTPEFKDCKEQSKRQVSETCTKIYPPELSFSECIKDPPPPMRMTECKKIVEEKCPEKQRQKSYDGCNPPPKKEIPCPPPRNQGKQKNKNKCEEETSKSCDAEPNKWGKQSFSKSPLKCSSKHNFKYNQIELNRHSHSFCNVNSAKSCEHGSRYPRRVSSYSLMDSASKGHMEYSEKSDSKSGSVSTDQSFRRNYSEVKKDKKSEKTCEKRQAPDCKAPPSIECTLKEMEPCEKPLAPKLSYSECIRENAHPPSFTECNMKKYNVCLDANKKLKSYDGGKKKEKQLVCPESPSEKRPKPSMKKTEKVDEYEKNECDNVESFILKTGYSKPPMKCSSAQIPQQHLPPIRSYSNIKINTPHNVNLPIRSTSYLDCQLKKTRTYSDQKSKSKSETVPCPDDPNPPCRSKEERSAKCHEAIVPAKHFIECPEPPKKRVFKCEPKVEKVVKKIQEVVKEKPKPKTYVECPKPIPKKTGSPCDVIETPPPPPPKKECPIFDKHFTECLRPPPKVQHTCEQPLMYKKEEKPPQREVGICKGDHLVKTFVECSEPPPRKKRIICDAPFLPRTEPCFGQVKVKEGEKGSRKKCGVDPDDETPACPEKKKDEKRKCSHYSKGNIVSFPPRSAGSTMKYSTSQPAESKTCSKIYQIPDFLSNKNTISSMCFSSPNTNINKHLGKKRVIPVIPTSTTGTTGYKITDCSNKFKNLGSPVYTSIMSGTTINFSTSKSLAKDDTNLCNNGKPQKKNSTSVKTEKCDSTKRTSPAIKKCEQPLQKVKTTCETVNNQLEHKIYIKNIPSSIPDMSKKKSNCPKRECCVSHKDSALEDILSTIKSFLKAREGCPEPRAKGKKTMSVAPPCKSIHEDSQDRQLKLKHSLSNQKEMGKENCDKTIEIKILGHRSQNTHKCPKITMPGCRVPESTSCSKQVGIRTENGCKQTLAPKPSFSECTKEPRSPRPFTECYTSVPIKCKTKAIKREPSPCEIHFQKNKSKLALNVDVQLQQSGKKQPQPSKESPIKSEKAADSSESNIFYRLLNKMSKLPECQTKHIEELSKHSNKEETGTQVVENICQVPKDEIKECKKIQLLNDHTRKEDCLIKEEICENLTNCEKGQDVSVVSEPIPEKKNLKKCLTPSTSVELERDEKKEPQTVRGDGAADSSESNIFYRLLNKKSKLPECQAKHIEELSKHPNKEETGTRVVENICQVPKEEIKECKEIQLQNDHTGKVDCQIKEEICENLTNCEKGQDMLKVVFEPIPEKNNLKNCLTPSTSVEVERDEKKEPQTIRKDGVCVPRGVPPEVSKEAPGCNEMETDKTKKTCEQSSTSDLSKTMKSTSRSPDISQNNKQYPKNSMFCTNSSNDNHKRSSSTLPAVKDVVCQINNKNILPYPEFNLDFGSEIKINAPSSITQENLKKESNCNKLVIENTTENPTNDTSHVSHVKKFPGIIATLSNIWSSCEKDISMNSILQLTNPVCPKLNPRYDSHLFESPVFQGNDETQKGVQPHSAGKVSQSEKMTREICIVEADHYLEKAAIIVCCNRACSVSDLAVLIRDNFRNQVSSGNAGFQRGFNYMILLPQVSSFISTDFNEISDLISKLFLNQTKSNMIYEYNYILLRHNIFSDLLSRTLTEYHWNYNSDKYLLRDKMNHIIFLSTKNYSTKMLSSKIKKYSASHFEHFYNPYEINFNRVMGNVPYSTMKLLNVPSVTYLRPNHKSFCDSGKKYKEKKQENEQKVENHNKKNVDTMITSNNKQCNTSRKQAQSQEGETPLYANKDECKKETIPVPSIKKETTEKKHTECKEPLKRDVHRCDKVNDKKTEEKVNIEISPKTPDCTCSKSKSEECKTKEIPPSPNKDNCEKGASSPCKTEDCIQADKPIFSPFKRLLEKLFGGPNEAEKPQITTGIECKNKVQKTSNIEVKCTKKNEKPSTKEVECKNKNEKLHAEQSPSPVKIEGKKKDGKKPAEQSQPLVKTECKKIDEILPADKSLPTKETESKKEEEKQPVEQSPLPIKIICKKKDEKPLADKSPQTKETESKKEDEKHSAVQSPLPIPIECNKKAKKLLEEQEPFSKNIGYEKATTCKTEKQLAESDKKESCKTKESFSMLGLILKPRIPDCYIKTKTKPLEEISPDCSPKKQMAESEELKCSPLSKVPKTKEEIESRKKSFKVTELSPIKNPPPLPPCDGMNSKQGEK